MKIITLLFLSAYFFWGAVVLPSGNFSVLPDLRDMYDHCKQTDDQNLTVIDFIADHLTDFDYAFDKDAQKPHPPMQFNHMQFQTIYFAQAFNICFKTHVVEKNDNPAYSDLFILSDFPSSIFHPPTV